MMAEAPKTLERLIVRELQGVGGLDTLELEPVKGGEDTPELQARQAITFSFATTSPVNRLTRAGILAIHFYDTDPDDVLEVAYTSEVPKLWIR